ncbi:MAG: Do family serine endopeptidase [Acidobacteria bacterium]|nr:Do family serine endopeptidase [Acidobacteriota bacterium]
MSNRLGTRTPAGALGLLLSLTLAAAAPAADSPARKAVAPPPAADGYAEIAAAALPAVASVYSSRTVPRTPPEQRSGQESEEDSAAHREHGLGSAVVIRPDGLLLTNDHVIDGADEVVVALSDGRELPAKVLGADPKTDIAVLKIDAQGLATLPFADSSKVRVGEFVLAIGNPFGVGQTMTFGIVSAKGRGDLGIEQYEDFIQTDAAINPGNSGGALINTRGELIGVNTAIVGPGGANNGIGFAVPVNMAAAVMQQILEHGRVVRGWMGVLVQPLTEREAKFFHLSKAGGALVDDVNPSGPAARGGLRRGDVILSLDGEAVVDSRAVVLKVSAMKPGATIRLGIAREGQPQTLSVTLGESPDGSGDESPGEDATGLLAGVAVQDLTPQILAELGLPSNVQGVVVDGVDPASAWADAGLSEGDVIEEINRKPIHNSREFEQAGKAVPHGQDMLLLVNREGSTSFVVVEM